MPKDEEPAGDGEWTRIKVAAAFGGLSFLPWWWGTSTNNANPLFEIGANGIRYRVIAKRERRFSEIESVDVRTAWRTVSLYFRFREGLGTFSANVREAGEAARALRLLQGKVRLGEKARKIVLDLEI